MSGAALAQVRGPAKVAVARLPYPGLRAFHSDESDLFFGRDECVDVMLDRLADRGFLAVLGPSGSGKSSLVRSGLIKALRLGDHPTGNARWKIADLSPGAEPLDRLAEALLVSVGGERPHKRQRAALATMLRRGPRSIIQWAEANLPERWNLLILVDQFEELFRYRDFGLREQRDMFVEQLMETAAHSNARISVVITMRSEYLGACSLLPHLSERIGESLYLTARMTLAQCREAIEGPARVVDLGLRPELVDRVIADLAGIAPWNTGEPDEQAEQLAREADQLPLMQHALNQMWLLARDREKSAPKELTLDDYSAIGGVGGAVNQQGDRILAGLAEADEELAALTAKVFRALVSGPSLSLAVRRPLTIGALVEETGAPRDQVQRVVEAFSHDECNFLRQSDRENIGGRQLIDISHESLIRQWKALAGWFKSEDDQAKNWLDLCRRASPDEKGDQMLLEGRPLVFYSDWWARVQPTAVWAKRYGGDFEQTRTFFEVSAQVDRERARAREERRAQAERDRLEAERQRLLAEQERRDEAARHRRALILTAVGTLSVVGGAFAINLYREQRHVAYLAEKQNDQLNEKVEALNAVNLVMESQCRSGGFQQRNEKLDQCVARLSRMYLPSHLTVPKQSKDGLGRGYGQPLVASPSARGGVAGAHGLRPPPSSKGNGR